MNLKEIANNIMMKIKRLTDSPAEVYIQKSRSTTIEVKEGKVDFINVASESGVGIRLLHGNRMGFSFSSDLGSDAIDKLCQRVIDSVKLTHEDRNYDFVRPPDDKYPALDIFDEKIKDISESDMIRKTIELEKTALEYDKRINKVRKASTSFSEYELLISNSFDVDANSKGTIFSASLTSLAEENGDAQVGWDYEIKRFFEEFDISQIGRNASKMAVGFLGAKRIDTIKTPVILSNLVASEFLSVLAPSFYGDNLLKGKSILANKIGKKIVSPKINIVDDGRLSKGIGSSPFDDEGETTRRKILVQDGLLHGYLYDTYSAKKANVQSTGNGMRKGFKGTVNVGITNFFIEKGDSDLDGLLKKMDKGIYILEVMGIHTADMISGNFSVGALGFWINNGEIDHPVREIVVSGNILDLFNSIEEVGDDTRFLGRIGSPSLLIGSISISGN